MTASQPDIEAHRPAMNELPDFVVLYQRPRRWLLSVHPRVISSITLDTPPDAPVDVAHREAIQHLREAGFAADDLAWMEFGSDAWIAVDSTEPES